MDAGADEGVVRQRAAEQVKAAIAAAPTWEAIEEAVARAIEQGDVSVIRAWQEVGLPILRAQQRRADSIPFEAGSEGRPSIARALRIPRLAQQLEDALGAPADMATRAHLGAETDATKMPGGASMAYVLSVKGTDTIIGEVTDAQVQQLIDLLEEEDSTDQDYYMDQAVLEYLVEQGADPALLDLLRPHIPTHGGVDIQWQEA